MKVRIHYQITEGPWGGGNSFLKAFRNLMQDDPSYGVQIADASDNDYDILFVNGGHSAPGTYVNPKEIKRIQKGSRLFGRPPRKVIYRLDGARFRYNRTRSKMDDLQYNVLRIADYTIFQSDDCVDSFRAMGYDGDQYAVIHNGVDQGIFHRDGRHPWNPDKPLRVFSSNWSASKHKGYDAIALFSRLPGVQSSFVGNWNQETDPGHVSIQGPVTQSELADIYRQHDVFLHAAEYDPCPNVLLEAMSTGMPVFYHDTGGSPDIAGSYGIRLPDKPDADGLATSLDQMKAQYRTLYDRVERDHENFGIRRAAAAYVDVFRKVLADGD